mgnify:CR=1 FL=1
MKLFSVHWKASKQPRKQRKYRHNAPLHTRQKLVSAHLDKALRKEYNVRSLSLRKGDEVVVLRGSYRKRKGVVARVDLKKTKIFVEGLKRKKVSGQEIDAPIDPSNLMITKLNLDDKKRRKFIERKKLSEKAVKIG